MTMISTQYHALCGNGSTWNRKPSALKPAAAHDCKYVTIFSYAFEGILQLNGSIRVQSCMHCSRTTLTWKVVATSYCTLSEIGYTKGAKENVRLDMLTR